MKFLIKADLTFIQNDTDTKTYKNEWRKITARRQTPKFSIVNMQELAAFIANDVLRRNRGLSLKAQQKWLKLNGYGRNITGTHCTRTR